MERSHQPVKIFYSYSHKDEKFREELETHLKILQRNNLISEWHDRKIAPGEEWAKEIDNNLEDSDLVLLLVSADFIASEYCWNREMTVSIDMHDSGRARVVPIVLRPTDWSDAPFSRLQALPKDAMPITKWDDRDDAWMNVANEISTLAKNIQEKKLRIDSGDYVVHSIRDWMTKSVEKIDVLFTTDSPVSGLSTGYAELDILTTGLHNSELIVVAARPSVGKTSFALNIVETIAIKEQCSVAIFSMDMSGESITTRLMTSLGNIDQHKARTGQFDDEDWPKLTASVGMLSDAPIYIDDTSVLTVESIKKRALKLSGDYGLDLVVIDYLQLISLASKVDGTTQTYSEVARELKMLAKELDVPIILISQLDRTLEQRPDKRPHITDLNKWDGVGDVADVVIFIYRDEIYNEFTPDNGIAEIIVGKNRNGRMGVARLAFVAKYSRFYNIAQ